MNAKLFDHENFKMLPDYTVNFQANSVKIINYNSELHDIPAVWVRTLGEGVKIGILDTGLPNHPDLTGKIADYANFTNEALATDVDGHATHVAGKFAAESTNPNVGIIGIAPKAKLYMGKIMNDHGMGSDKWLAEGIRWCISKGCHIINMSLGAPASAEDRFPLSRRAVLEAYAKNIYMFAAVGNEGINSISLPAKWNEVFAIVSIDKSSNHSSFSNTGPEADFSGLGEEVVSTYLGGKYASLSGTSFASPDVAAIAALIVSDHLNNTDCKQTPLENFWDMRKHLISICTDLGTVGHDNTFGWGNPVFSPPTKGLEYNDVGGIIPEPKPIPKVPLFKRLFGWIFG